jgi:hypothetical protein
LAILETSETGVLSRLTLVPRKMVSQSLVYALAHQNPHSGLGGQKLLSFFQGCDGHLAAHRRKTFQELLQRLSGFERIDRA